jgi:hypothetical protein
VHKMLARACRIIQKYFLRSFSKPYAKYEGIFASR